MFPWRAMIRRYCKLGVIACFALQVAAQQKPAPAPVLPKLYRYRVVRSYPHDSNAFTQGLVLIDGRLYESTGLYGSSSVRIEDPATGRIFRQVHLGDRVFGEGLTDWESTLIQITWQSHQVFVYDRATLRLLKTLSWPKEGWGLTHDNKSLILSDGSSTLYFLDPATFQVLRQITVRDRGREISNLNELEYVHGQIFANIWHQDRIACISPQTGQVVGWIDLSGLLSPMFQRGPEDVLNGIAYDARQDRLLVTGKRWPILFEIQIVAK